MSMTISQIIAEKHELKKNMAKLLTGFANKTDISHIEIHNNPMWNYDRKPEEPKYKDFNVQIILKI